MKLGKLLINALLIFMLLLKKSGVGGGAGGGRAPVNGARLKIGSFMPGQRGCTDHGRFACVSLSK